MLQLSPLGKGCDPSLKKNKLKSPSSLPSLIEIGEENANVKSLQTYRQMDKQRTTSDQKSSLEDSAHVLHVGP